MQKSKFNLLIGLLVFMGACTSDPIEVNEFMPADPDGLPVLLNSAELFEDSIVLNWIDNALVQDQYDIYRKTELATFSKIGTVSYPGHSFADSLIEEQTIYYYYVESVAGSKIEKSNEIKVDTVPSKTNRVPEPEYYLYGSSYFTTTIETGNDTDVFYWDPYGSDFDIQIYNYSSNLDVAFRVWDEYDNLLIDYNGVGAGYSESLYNLGYSTYFIIEVYSINNTTGSYEISVY
jgi:hypothetical protein